MRVLAYGIPESNADSFDQIEFAEDIDDVVSLAKLYDFEIILIGKRCAATVTAIRAAGVPTGVIAISESGALADIVATLDCGADDYMTRPIAIDELNARIRAVVRRAAGHARSLIGIGNLVLDLSMKSASANGVRVPLTGKEYQILELLAIRRNAVQTKESILNYLYGGMDEPEIKIIDVFICKLRKKLADADGPEIETIWGRGYVLQDKINAPSLVPEIADMMDDPPVHVSKMTVEEYDAMRGGEKTPPIVPEA